MHDGYQKVAMTSMATIGCFTSNTLVYMGSVLNLYHCSSLVRVAISLEI